MKIVLLGEDRIRLEVAGDGFGIVAEDTPISPYHLLGASLASCTALTLESWARPAGIDVQPLTIDVSWVHASTRPKRVERIEMALRWPGLPPARLVAAERVADLCPIHATLRRGTEIARRVEAVPREG